MQTDESGSLVRSWRHAIKVGVGAAGNAVYSDEVSIDAGWRTFPIWLWAQWFFRRRHRRWRKLAPTLV